MKPAGNVRLLEYWWGLGLVALEQWRELGASILLLLPPPQPIDSEPENHTSPEISSDSMSMWKAAF